MGNIHTEKMNGTDTRMQYSWDVIKNDMHNEQLESHYSQAIFIQNANITTGVQRPFNAKINTYHTKGSH